jgi:RNA 2',3'-cyclic 3'-phosphodiesterase
VRVFVAVWPPAEAVRAVAALDRPSVPGLRWVPAERWHVTLRFCGQVADGDVADLVAALGDGLAGEGPVTARLGPATDRFGDRVLHAPVSGLQDLAARVRHVTAPFGDAPVDAAEPFHGHLTLARARRGVPAGLVGVPVAPVPWPVPEIAVVASAPTADRGPRYETVASVPLGAGLTV